MNAYKLVSIETREKAPIKSSIKYWEGLLADIYEPEYLTELFAGSFSMPAFFFKKWQLSYLADKTVQAINDHQGLIRAIRAQIVGFFRSISSQAHTSPIGEISRYTKDATLSPILQLIFMMAKAEFALESSPGADSDSETIAQIQQIQSGIEARFPSCLKKDSQIDISLETLSSSLPEYTVLLRHLLDSYTFKRSNFVGAKTIIEESAYKGSIFQSSVIKHENKRGHSPVKCYRFDLKN